jgi:hypothetical protein
MNTFKKLKLVPILIFLLTTIFSACIDESYDLTNGLSTVMTVGGDSLSIPIGKSSKIFLDSMMTKQQIEMLEIMEDSTYSFSMYDSMKVSMEGIIPFLLPVSPIEIAPISASFGDIKLPSFNLNPISSQTSLPIPQIVINPELIAPIENSYTQDFLISAPSGARSSIVAKTKSTSGLIGPFRKTSTNTFDETIQYIFTNELKRINKILLNSTKVTLIFDKTKTNQLGLTSQNDTIKQFKIDFPAEYKLSSPVGLNSRVDGSSFIISNAILAQGVNVFTASFVIESIDLSNFFQFESLIYKKPINYSIDYSFQGQSDNPSALYGKNVEYTVGLKATPIISDMDLETNTIEVTIPAGEIAINKVIENIPNEISQIGSISFADGASMLLNVADPGIFPFSFTAGQCQISLPQSFTFKSYTGLNNSTNLLSIPYNTLFGGKLIGVSGMNLNKILAEGQTSVVYSDKISYRFSGLTIGSQITTLKTIQGLTNKLLNITGTCSGLTVKNASLTTRRISVDIPQKTSSFTVNKFISNDVKRIYTAALKTPSTVALNLTISKLPSSVDSVFFENFTIQLPSYLKFKTGDVNSQNQVILNRGFKVSNGFTKTLTLEKIDFGTNGKLLNNGTFSLNDAITMIGKIYVKGTNLNFADLGVIDIKPNVQISDIALSVIEGEITPVIPQITKVMTMNFPEFLKQSGTKLDVQNPVITMEVGSSMGIPVDATVNIVPKKAGVAIPNASISSQVSIPAAQTVGVTSWNKFWIAKSSSGISNQYQAIVIPTLPSLFMVAPDEIEITVTPTVSGTRQTIDLYSTKNRFEVQYAIHVPFDFGIELNVHYNDTISNLKPKLAELIKYTRKFDVIASIENKIPLDLNFELIPMDESFNVISGISVTTTDSIRSCNIDGTPQFSILNINIKETTPEALDQLNAFKLIFSATKNSTVAGMPLRTNQYFIMELRVQIPEGITINQP